MRPMLAAPLKDLNAVKFPAMASAKLDGVRAVVIDGVVYARSLKRIPNRHVQALFGHEDFDGLDGELIVGEPTHPDCYRTTVSGVMSGEGEPDVMFYVFDDFLDPTIPFSQRFNKVQGRVRRLGSGVYCVYHALVRDLEDLENLEEFWLSQGYEGVMLRSIEGPYKYGRSTLKEGWLLKLKRFKDAEALVLDCYEQMRNSNEATCNALGLKARSTHRANKHGKGTLGHLRVRDLATGVEFDIGTGFDNFTRDLIWKNHVMQEGSLAPVVGKIVKYRYFPTGSKERPRFPTWVGFRDPIDMGE